jgi:hypothetical protein
MQKNIYPQNNMEKLESIVTRINWLHQTKGFNTQTISWEWDLSEKEQEKLTVLLTSQNWPLWNLKHRELTLYLKPVLMETIQHKLKFSKELHYSLCNLKGSAYEKTDWFKYYYMFTYWVNDNFYKTYLTIDFRDKDFYVRWEFNEKDLITINSRWVYDIREASDNFKEICERLEELAKPPSRIDQFFNLFS